MTKSLDRIQHLLPLGYLYLIILGIIKQSLYFYQLDINILKYSSIMDVLISPVADLTSEPVILGAVAFLIGLSLALQFVFSKNSEKIWVQKFLGKEATGKTLSKEEIKNLIARTFLAFFIAGLSSFFFSLGIDNGYNLVKKIQSGTLSYDHKIRFDGEKAEDIHLIDVTSSYCFYISKGSKNIKIAPVGSIKNFELIHNKKL